VIDKLYKLSKYITDELFDGNPYELETGERKEKSTLYTNYFNRRNRMISTKTINSLVKIIVEEEKPEKVILFGSYSTGVPNEASDVDILIVKETNVPKPKRSHRLLRRFSSYPFNMDIIVKTPEEFEKQANIPGSFVSIIKRKGKILYG